MRELLLAPPAKFGAARDRDVFVSSSASYSRNLDGAVFPRKASKEEAAAVRERVLDALGDEFAAVFLEEAERAETDAFVERGILDRSEADESYGTRSKAVAFRRDGIESCVVNGTDHLRLAVHGSGLSIEESFLRLRGRETELEDRLRFAASLQHGYLTAMPED
jgi:protein arginine kinase